MKWRDINGNEHVINENVELLAQQPNCKYLLPCGICTMFSELRTCSLLMNKTPVLKFVDEEKTYKENDHD